MASEYVRTHGRMVDELMTREVVSVAADTPLDEIVALMERHRIKRVPVLDDGMLVGIVSRADLLALLARALDAQAAAAASDEDIRERVLAELAKRLGAARRPDDHRHGRRRLSHGVILDEKEREALRVAAENVPGVKAVEDHLVWVEPVSGTVIEAVQEPPQSDQAACALITRRIGSAANTRESTIYRIGIDVGGTFTDLVAVDDIGRATRTEGPVDPQRSLDRRARRAGSPGAKAWVQLRDAAGRDRTHHPRHHGCYQRPAGAHGAGEFGCYYRRPSRCDPRCARAEGRSLQSAPAAGRTTGPVGCGWGCASGCVVMAGSRRRH